MDTTKDLVDNRGDDGRIEGGGGGGGGGGEEEERGKRGFFRVFYLRCLFTLFFSILVSFLFSFFVALVAVVFRVFSNLQAVSISTDCRIISSGVDLRSSKVCKLGVPVYNAKDIFYTWEKTGVRCRDDYYWASIFNVEYKDYLSGNLLHAVAEAPKEALPLDCRPTFGTALSIKSKFTVNETYKCWYTPGIVKAVIYQDDLFNCHSKEPSNTEIVRKLFILYLFSLDNFSSRQTLLFAFTGVITGMLIALFLFVMLKAGEVSRLSLTRKWNVGKQYLSILASHVKQACIFAAYFSVTGWITLQYTKTIGLKQLFYKNETE